MLSVSPRRQDRWNRLVEQVPKLSEDFVLLLNVLQPRCRRSRSDREDETTELENGCNFRDGRLSKERKAFYSTNRKTTFKLCTSMNRS